MGVLYKQLYVCVFNNIQPTVDSGPMHKDADFVADDEFHCTRPRFVLACSNRAAEKAIVQLIWVQSIFADCYVVPLVLPDLIHK